jgi:hypothetical protein
MLRFLFFFFVFFCCFFFFFFFFGFWLFHSWLHMPDADSDRVLLTSSRESKRCVSDAIIGIRLPSSARTLNLNGTTDRRPPTLSSRSQGNPIHW